MNVSRKDVTEITFDLSNPAECVIVADRYGIDYMISEVIRTVTGSADWRNGADTKIEVTGIKVTKSGKLHGSAGRTDISGAAVEYAAAEILRSITTEVAR